MKAFTLLAPFFFLLAQSTYALAPVPYSGKVAINGVNYFGEAQFTFSLHDGKDTTHWRNGNKAGDTIKVSVLNGRYNVLLGGQGMNPLPPELFLNHEELYLKVEFDNGEGKGLQHLGPDQLITATPRALVADLAKRAMLADKVTTGAVTRAMLSAEVLSDLNQSIQVITREMLPASVLGDLNRTVTKSMLGSDVLADLNRTVTPQMIQSSSITTAQLNEQILKYLKPEITVSPQAPGLIFSGQSMNLTSQAQGKYLTYQWQRNGQPIVGATQASFSIADVNGSLHDGNYSVLVSNDFGSVTSALTPLQVDGTPSAHTVSSISMEMIFCPPGTFTMGSPTTETGRVTNETEHNVTLTKGFYLGKYEVTQAQYQAVMTGNTDSLSATPSEWPNNPNRPVEKVSWADAQIFLTRLNAQQSANIPAGWAYVLPTESQWEYACRAGTTTMYSWEDDINATRANYSVSGLSQTRDVGYYAANPWGFFDMHGNVWEWTADWYQAAYPTGNPVVDPSGPASGSNRVQRGGSWFFDGAGLRSALRFYDTPSTRYDDLGFRVGFQQQ
jgi:sulfatase modifying factor 1